MTELEPIDSARDLLQMTELVGVKTYELRARLLEEGVSATPADEVDVDGSELDDPILELMVRHEGMLIEARLRFEQRTKEAVLNADIAVIYRMSEEREITGSALAEFLEKVGVMAAFPFVREATATSASRLGVPVPVLGLLRAGGFSVGVPTASESAATD